MWKMHEIREIIKLFEESSIQEFEIELEEAESKIFLRKQGNVVLSNYKNIESINTVAYTPTALSNSVPKTSTLTEKKIPKPPVQPSESKTAQVEPPKSIDALDPALFKIVSPMVGTFYQAPGQDADPFVKPGDKVQKSTVVCIVEAMKLFNEIEAEVHGEIVDVLVENGQLVEYGQPLFLVRTE